MSSLYEAYWPGGRYIVPKSGAPRLELLDRPIDQAVYEAYRARNELGLLFDAQTEVVDILEDLFEPIAEVVEPRARTAMRADQFEERFLDGGDQGQPADVLLPVKRAFVSPVLIVIAHIAQAIASTLRIKGRASK